MPGKNRLSKRRATLKWLEKKKQMDRISKNHAAQVHAEIWLAKEQEEYQRRKEKPKEAQ
jgi:hypothetical protein